MLGNALAGLFEGRARRDLRSSRHRSPVAGPKRWICEEFGRLARAFREGRRRERERWPCRSCLKSRPSAALCGSGCEGVRILQVRVIEGRLRQPVAADFATPPGGKEGGCGNPARQIHRGGPGRRLDLGLSPGHVGKADFPGARRVHGEARSHRVHARRRQRSSLSRPAPVRALRGPAGCREVDAWLPFARLGIGSAGPPFHRGLPLSASCTGPAGASGICCWTSRSSAGSATFTSTRCCFAWGFVPPVSGHRVSRAIECGAGARDSRRCCARPSGGAEARCRTTATATIIAAVFSGGSGSMTGKGAPCYQCQTPIKRIGLGNRGVFYCPRCQRR